MNIRFTAATQADEPAIRILLKDAGLPHEDFAAHLSSFITAKDGDTLAGAVGMEAYGPAALVRSLAVAVPFRGAGIGGMLYERIEQQARGSGVHTLYLLTQTAEHFFTKRGYRIVKRGDAPVALWQTAEFLSLCPANAICMKKEIRQAP